MGCGQMILLSSIIKEFDQSFLTQYESRLLPSHHKALAAMKNCRSKQSRKMLIECTQCEHYEYIPHSCGHRNCPHCQAHESQQWLERQLKKQVPADYFMLTFTIPKELRPLAWQHQRTMYSLMIKAAWDTLQTFTKNDKKLQGTAGAIAVLHTHSRRLDFHPHVHVVMPAGAIDSKKRLWRTKKNKKPFLFEHKALAKVFRAKMLEAINQAKLNLPLKYPEKWVAHCKHVGEGDKALVYLGRYLYRGVIQEKNIISCENGNVTFTYQNSDTKKTEYKTVPGEQFLWLLLQHVLPKSFRRARNFGFLHPNSKQLIQILQLICKLDPNKAVAWIKKRPQMRCRCCGAEMAITETRIHSIFSNDAMEAPT